LIKNLCYGTIKMYHPMLLSHKKITKENLITSLNLVHWKNKIIDWTFKTPRYQWLQSPNSSGWFRCSWVNFFVFPRIYTDGCASFLKSDNLVVQERDGEFHVAQHLVHHLQHWRKRFYHRLLKDWLGLKIALMGARLVPLLGTAKQHLWKTEFSGVHPQIFYKSREEDT
jgi:hypothetical protein